MAGKGGALPGGRTAQAHRPVGLRREAVFDVIVQEARFPCLEGATAAIAGQRLGGAAEVLAPAPRRARDRQPAAQDVRRQWQQQAAPPGRRHDRRIDHQQRPGQLGRAGQRQQRRGGAHRVAGDEAGHGVPARQLAHRRHHIGRIRVPVGEEGRARRQHRVAVPAQVQRNHPEAIGQRLQQLPVGERVEAGGVQEDQVDRTLRAAEVQTGQVAAAGGDHQSLHGGLRK